MTNNLANGRMRYVMSARNDQSVFFIMIVCHFTVQKHNENILWFYATEVAKLTDEMDAVHINGNCFSFWDK